MKIDARKVRVPVYVAGGTEDRIISAGLTKRTARHYGVRPRLHEGRGHWTIGEPGWESLVDDVATWLDSLVSRAASRTSYVRRAHVSTEGIVRRRMHAVLRRLTDLAGALSLATDLAHGAPPEHQLRVAVLCSRVATELGLDDDDRRDAFDAGLLRWLGCTAVAQPLARWMGDEIASHRCGARFDGPLDPLLEILRKRGAGRPVPQRVVVLAGALRTGPGPLFASTCEAAADLAGRWGVLRQRGWRAVRCVRALRRQGLARQARRRHHPGCGADRHGRRGHRDHRRVRRPGDRRARVARRAGRQHHPSVVAALQRVHRATHDDFDSGDAWGLVSTADPRPDRCIADDQIEECLLVVADLVDLKVPTMAGHPRAVAALSAGAAALLGGDQVEVRHAGLLHDIGRVSVSNDVWTRPGPLSSADRERVRLAPHHTERIWSHSTWLAPIGALASQHAERLDGSGYHRGLAGSALTPAARVLQAAKRYRSLVEERPHRPAHAPGRAAELLRQAAAAGKFDPHVVEAVVAAAGGRAKARRAYPDGLTGREVEVLRLVAQGLPNKEVATRLVIAHRTVGAPRRPHLRQDRRHDPGGSSPLRHAQPAGRNIGQRTDEPVTHLDLPWRDPQPDPEDTMSTVTRTKTLTRLDAEALFDAMCQAWNAADAPGIAATYAPDGRLVDPLGHEWDGRETISAAFQDYFGGLLAGTTTEITIESVRELAPGLAVIDGWQTFTGPLPGMHLTAVVRAEGDGAQVLECRPYVFLELPADG